MSVYLDHSATTPIDPSVAEAMHQWLLEKSGNPSSPHRDGQKAKIRLEQARDAVAAELNCLPKEITFTSGGTESNNLGLIGAATAQREKGRHVIVSAIEHPSVLSAAQYLEQNGFDVQRAMPGKNGVVEAETIKKMVRDDTILVSLMLVNNETGVIQPVQEVAAFCRERDIVVHCDAIQAFAKYPIDLQKLAVDFLSFSAHKINGPAGVGGLFVRSGVPLEARSFGGGQEANRRPGTENMTGIVGLGAALELYRNKEENLRRMEELQQFFESELKQKHPSVVIVGAQGPRSPFISCVAFPGIDNQAMLLNLDMAGVSASVGSACSSGSIKQSHVLQALKLDENIVASAIRFSFGLRTSKVELRQALDAIETVTVRLSRHAVV